MNVKFWSREAPSDLGSAEEGQKQKNLFHVVVLMLECRELVDQLKALDLKAFSGFQVLEISRGLEVPCTDVSMYY